MPGERPQRLSCRRIPQFERLVEAAGDDLGPIRREVDRVDRVRMSDQHVRIARLFLSKSRERQANQNQGRGERHPQTFRHEKSSVRIESAGDAGDQNVSLSLGNSRVNAIAWISQGKPRNWKYMK